MGADQIVLCGTRLRRLCGWGSTADGGGGGGLADQRGASVDVVAGHDGVDSAPAGRSGGGRLTSDAVDGAPDRPTFTMQMFSDFRPFVR